MENCLDGDIVSEAGVDHEMEIVTGGPESESLDQTAFVHSLDSAPGRSEYCCFDGAQPDRVPAMINAKTGMSLITAIFMIVFRA